MKELGEGDVVTSIINVARYILDEVGEMSTMKLQKLCYFSQGWTLAWTTEPLFDEDFQAWKNGPVCYELFKFHRGFYYVDLDAAKSWEFPEAELSADQKAYVNAAIAPYRSQSGLQLSEITHGDGPWIDVRHGLASGSSSQQVIGKEMMASYFINLG